MTDELSQTIRIARQHGIGDTLRRAARRFPDKPAVICGETAWTYEAFDRIANRLARGLAARGVGEGDRVAIVSRNSHAFAALRYAVARMGAVLVPINFMLNAHEIAYILQSSGARLLAFGPEFGPVCREAAEGSAVEGMLALPGESLPAETGHAPDFEAALDADDSPVMSGAGGDDLAQIIYTSGTESLPKGAMLTHGAVMWQYITVLAECEMHAGDVMLHALPLYHCAQLDVLLGPAVYLGMTNVITGTPSPESILPLLERHGVTYFFAPPSVWISLLRSPLMEETDLSKLVKGLYGASIMPVEVLREMQRRLPQMRLWNLYGQTEIAPTATILPADEQISRAGSAGRPGLNVETRVVDDEMRDVAPGEVGEVVHRSPQLMSGYWNDPERTAEAFRGGWFHSGDLAVVEADGYITIVDRKKDMIKTGGENVASREVEECVYLLPGVSEVAVIGLPHERWIEAVTAVVVPKSGERLEEGEIIEHCRRELAHYKAPKRVVFVEELPRNPSGKILKRELRERLAASAPSDAAG